MERMNPEPSGVEALPFGKLAIGLSVFSALHQVQVLSNFCDIAESTCTRDMVEQDRARNGRISSNFIMVFGQV